MRDPYCLQPPFGSAPQPFSVGAGAAPQCPSEMTPQPFSAQRAEIKPRIHPPKSHLTGTAEAGAAARNRAITTAAAGRMDRWERIVDIENLPFRGAGRAGRNGRRLRPGGEYGAANRGNLPSKHLVFRYFAHRRGVDEAA